MAYQKTITLLLIALCLPAISWATNGYFQHGIGVKEQSLGGAAIAYPQSALSVATNPASATAIGQRLDVGLDWFSPDRSADLGGTGYLESDSTTFFIPQFGYNHPLNEKVSLAFVAYANGGMQTDWPTNFLAPTNPINSFCSLEQIILAPSIAFKVTPNHALGISANYIYQTFEERGLEPSNIGEEVSTGWGLRVGYVGQVSPWLRVGAFWQPRTHMEKFDKYRDLFPENGGFDIPETFGAGLAVEISEKLQVAADLVKINYADIPALGHLGTSPEPGFGWQDITVVKVGVAYDYTPALTLRMGWNHGETPLRSSQTTMNVLCPATITVHLTLGFSYALTDHSEWSMTYWHGLENEVEGDGVDMANIKMHQDNIGLAYSWIFD